MDKFIKFLVKRRKALLLTQSEVSRRLGLGQIQQMSNIERGESTFPEKHLKRLSHVLGVPLKELFKVYMEDVTEMYWKRVRREK